jgi:hypothetical protein
MESFLTAIPGRRGDDATAKAQDVMYEAWERTRSAPEKRSDHLSRRGERGGQDDAQSRDRGTHRCAI